MPVVGSRRRHPVIVTTCPSSALIFVRDFTVESCALSVTPSAHSATPIGTMNFMFCTPAVVLQELFPALEARRHRLETAGVARTMPSQRIDIVEERDVGTQRGQR